MNIIFDCFLIFGDERERKEIPLCCAKRIEEWIKGFILNNDPNLLETGQYGLTIPKANMTVGVPINITLRSHPNSLATLHIYDSRLDALIKRSVPSTSSNHLWTFSEFLSPEPGEHYYDNFIWFSNVVELHKLFLKRKEICQRAGKLAPQCPVEDNDKILNEHLQPFGKTKIPISASRFSTECLREIQEECERQKTIRQNANGFLTEKGQNNQQQNAWPLKTSGNGNQFMWMLNKKSYVQNALRNGNQQTSNDNENVLLRHFFPEVWMFNDFYIGQKGELELNLNTPHTVTEWLFIPKFWTNGRRDVCKLVNKESLFVQKNVFMDVDVPSHIYVNETVTVKVTVTAENLNKNGESKRMAVCFKGLSPSVCGDVGRDGTAGEIDFTRIELTVEKPVQQKRFFVRFLRPGLHNLSFELRNEEVLKGHGWHCRDGNIHIFDRIVKQISVTNRVDIEEHFRQIVLYQRQSLPSRTVTLEQVLGEKQSKSESTTVGHSSQNYLTLRSSQDVISYSQQQPLKEEESEGEEDDTTIIDTEQVKRQLITQIQINPGGLRVYSIGVEFSKFVASFPPALSTELIAASSPLSPQSDQYLQRLRNRSPVNLLSPSIAENLQTRRKRSKGKKGRKHKEIPIRKMPRLGLIKGIDLENGKENERPLQGYSLPNLLKELAQASYEFKSLRALLAGIESSTRIEREWLEQRERRLGNLLSELLTFSDCHGKKLCAFGEFGKPNKPEERSLVLTSLATSLLCEQRTPDEYICAPIQYLAQSVMKILNEDEEKDQIIAGLDAFAHFVIKFKFYISIKMGFIKTTNDKKSKWLFLQALIVQVVLDCSAYACAAPLMNDQSSLAKEAWMKLHSSFYRSVDLSEDYDVRVIAAFAYMSTPAIRSEMRAKLASRTVNDNHVPYWSVKEDSAKKSVKIQNLLEKSLQRSSIVLLNALALLAYTQNQSIYKFWRNEFNLEALSNWLIEQQDSNRQYENALDTFFATRALHQFAVVNAQRQMRQALTGTINANFTVYSPSSLPNNSRLFKDQDLPFGMFVEPTVRQMELKSRGDSQLLLGVKVQIEKRRRSRRDPNDVEPIVLSLEQKRIQHGFINQTVTIRCNSHLLNSIQIEHGIFTGFSSFAHFVHILKGSAKFQVEPRISATAVHFVLTNLIKEVDVVYTVALIEPNGGYLPENLAPISISAMHHHLPLAQLIVLPQDFDFLEDISNVELTSRGRRSVLTDSEKEVLPPAIFPVATSFLSPLETTKKEEGIDSLTVNLINKLMKYLIKASQSHTSNL
uniref:A2M domain-containing protein n=1 Tax=Meloidogyne hapla TaxID=6305 RepID=A0A1I8BW26_MELHA